jgi:putative sigma-54 modulation protein
MKITGRHLVITPALRQHIESRFERLVRYEVKLSHLEVILGVSKLQHSAEVVCTMQGRRIQAGFDAGNVRDDRPACGSFEHSNTKT